MINFLAEPIVDPNEAITKGDGSEEKKHKKKHKKRSSKHGHAEASKNSDGEKAIDEVYDIYFSIFRLHSYL